MDEIDIMNKALSEYDNALRLKRLNQELYNQLTGSIFYLLKYSEKYDVLLPQKEALLSMIERADFIIDQFAKPSQPPVNAENDQPSSEQNPERDSVKLLSAFLPVKSVTCNAKLGVS